MTTKSKSAQFAATQPQLLLISESSTPAHHWQLDAETREIGRKGLEQARAALNASRRPPFDLAA